MVQIEKTSPTPWHSVALREDPTASYSSIQLQQLVLLGWFAPVGDQRFRAPTPCEAGTGIACATCPISGRVLAQSTQWWTVYTKNGSTRIKAGRMSGFNRIHLFWHRDCLALCNSRLYRLLVMFREMQQSFLEASAFLESFPSETKRYTGDKE